MRFLTAFMICFVAATLPAASFAATTMTRMEGMTTTVFQEGQTSFSGLGVRFDFQSDATAKGFSFLPGLEYWRNSTSLKPYEIDAMRRDATIAFDARYLFTFNNVSPYLGAGYGIHFLTTEVSAPTLGLQHAETSLIKGGVSAMAGILFPLGGKLQNFAEIKYHHVVDYRQYKFNLGISWGF